MKNPFTGEVVGALDMWISGFIMMLALAILVTPATPKTSVGDKPICTMTIDIEWHEQTNADVDLWVKARDNNPVGYSAKDSASLNLVRDDLGYLNDPTPINAERVCARGNLPGEYVVNVHLFSLRVGADKRVPVHVRVATVEPSTAYTAVIWEGDVALKRLGEELTVIRFVLDDQGRLIPGSLHDLPMALRADNKQTGFGRE